MDRNRNRVLRALVMSICVMLFCTGCSASPSSQPEPDAGTQDSRSSARIAASLSDYAQSLLDSDESGPTPMAQSQREILQKAADTGEITAGDYERAWAGYRQCVVDRGWTDPVLRRYPNGIIENSSMDISGLTEDQDRQVTRDAVECTNLYVRDVATVYGFQVGNASLLQDADSAIVDCLHQANLVPSDYDATTFRRERPLYLDDENTVLDFSDMEVRGCFAANGSGSLGNEHDESWRPLG